MYKCYAHILYNIIYSSKKKKQLFNNIKYKIDYLFLKKCRINLQVVINL